MVGQLAAACAEQWSEGWPEEAKERRRAPKSAWLPARLAVSRKGPRIAALWIRKPSRVPNTNPARNTQNAQHSDFSEAPPDVLITSPSDKSATPGGEAIISKDGKPIVGITYPSDWKQKAGDNSVSAISKKGNAWSVIATLDGVKDKQAGIKKIKQGLEKYLKNIEYDDPTKTENGALLITGTGTGKKGGTDVVFAAGVLDAAPGQLAGAAFIVDKSVDDRYKEAVRYIVKTIRTGKDLTEQKHEVAKPVSSNN